MSTPNPASVVTVLNRFRREADRQNAVVLRQLGTAYAQLYRRLSEKIELEARRIFENGGDTVSRQWIQKRLGDLREQMEDEIRRYSVFVEGVIDANTDDMLTMGSRHALELMKRATAGQKGLIAVNFNRLNTEQINSIIGFLSAGSPLRDRIAQMASFHTQRVVNELTEAIALGYNPYKTAKNITPFLTNVQQTATNGMASVLATAVRLARTAQVWTLREAARANYEANSDIVESWQWNCSLDDVTCAACLSLHGTIHPLDEPLEGHPNCRCFPTPVVLGNGLLPETAGREHFDNLSAQQQRELLGSKAYEAFKDGRFDFEQLHTQRPDEVYGHFQVVPSLKELIGE
jgi:hypothetical protein